MVNQRLRPPTPATRAKTCLVLKHVLRKILGRFRLCTSLRESF
jgi:hypothetical protein